MITMTHNDEAVFLEPYAFGRSDLVGFEGDNKHVRKDDTNKNKSKLVSIGGVLHSLHETTTKSRHNLHLEEGLIFPGSHENFKFENSASRDYIIYSYQIQIIVYTNK